MAPASVAGMKYCLALLSLCFLARSSWRARLALGAVRAIPPVFFFRPAPLWLLPGRRTLSC